MAQEKNGNSSTNRGSMKSYQYTLCFIKRADEILLLNRNKHPWIGRWTGVGGRLEKGESPVECILREVLEETGITLSEVCDCGVVTWKVDGSPLGGMHIYLADVADDFIYNTPRSMEEGIVDWKKIDWIMHLKKHRYS